LAKTSEFYKHIVPTRPKKGNLFL